VIDAKYILKNEYIGEFVDDLDDYRSRYKYIRKYGFVLLSRAVVCKIALLCKDKTVLDVASGTGWLAHRVSQAGISVTALDDGSWPIDFKIWKRDIVVDALNFDYANFDVVLLAWPPYDTSFGNEVLNKMSSGQMLVYQGESPGGCTGDDDFFETLFEQYVEDVEAGDVLNEHHVQFEGIHDYWSVYTKL
jgi:hypothetical protein